jgi:hypothetical protein
MKAQGVLDYEEYVIERVSEMSREFWTGDGWSRDESDAVWFEERPIAPVVTDCETAQAVAYPGGWFDD